MMDTTLGSGTRGGFEARNLRYNSVLNADCSVQESDHGRAP